MHIKPVAASIVALAALLGGLTTSFDADTPAAGQPDATVVSTLDDNNGNG